MAIEKIVEIKVDAKQATKSLQDLGGSFEDVYGEVQPLSGRIGELEDRLYEMALAGESGTKEFKDLTKEIGSMKKVIIDTDRTVDGMSQTLAQNLGGAIGGVTSAFELGIGTVAAFGVESAKVEEALLKVQSASAIAQGFQGIRESVSSFKALSAAIKASTVVQTVLNGVTAAYNVIMNLNPIGLIITSIGALIAGIVALISNFRAITDWLGITDDAAETLHQNNLKRNEAERKASERRISDLKKEREERDRLHSFQERMMQAQGVAEEEIFKAVRKNRLERIAASNDFQRSLKNDNDLLTAQFKLLQKNGDLTTEQADEINAKIESNNEAIRSTISESKDLLEQIRLDDVSSVRKAEEEKADIRKEAFEKYKEKRIAEMDEMARLERAHQEGLADIEQYIKDRDALRDKEAKDHIERMQSVQDEIGAFMDNELAIEEVKIDTAQKTAADLKKLDDEDLARKAENADKSLQMANDSLGAISGLITSFAGEGEAAQRKAFEVNKAISIGQAIISTAQGIIAQLAVPQDALTGANFIKAGIVAATGAAQIATISRTQFSGGAGTTPAAPNTPATSTSQPANFNVVGNTGTNQLADTLGSSPMKAYVVAGDVTSAQSLERNKIQQSTL